MKHHQLLVNLLFGTTVYITMNYNYLFENTYIIVQDEIAGYYTGVMFIIFQVNYIQKSIQNAFENIVGERP